MFVSVWLNLRLSSCRGTTSQLWTGARIRKLQNQRSLLPVLEANLPKLSKNRRLLLLPTQSPIKRSRNQPKKRQRRSNVKLNFKVLALMAAGRQRMVEWACPFSDKFTGTISCGELIRRMNRHPVRVAWRFTDDSQTIHSDELDLNRWPESLLNWLLLLAYYCWLFEGPPHLRSLLGGLIISIQLCWMYHY